MFLPNLGIIRENVEVGIIIRWKKISNLGLSLQMSSFSFVNKPGEECLFLAFGKYFWKVSLEGHRIIPELVWTWIRPPGRFECGWKGRTVSIGGGRHLCLGSVVWRVASRD